MEIALQWLPICAIIVSPFWPVAYQDIRCRHGLTVAVAPNSPRIASPEVEFVQ